MKKHIILLFVLLCNSVHAFTPIMISDLNRPGIKKIDQFNPNKLKHYYKLTRPVSIPYEFGLPLVGGYLTTSDINVFTDPMVLFIGLLSVLIGSNSMIINDYFDYRSRVDKSDINKVLNQKFVKAEEVLHISYILSMISFYLINIFIDNNLVRFILSNAIVFSYIYTPFLKPITFVKNISASLVVTQSLTISSLIVNRQIRSIMPVAFYLFNMIMWQELQLDILDIEQDRKTNIKTIPVVYGKRNTHILSSILLISGILIPYGFNSHLFILLHIPLIFKTLIGIKTEKKLKEKDINLFRIIMLFSGVHMCLLLK